MQTSRFDPPSVRADEAPRPEVRALASLEGAVLRPVIDPPSDDELDRAWRDEVRARADLVEHEVVAAGDEVCVDLLDFAAGPLGELHEQRWLTAADDARWPGLRAGLEGAAVGDSRALAVGERRVVVTVHAAGPATAAPVDEAALDELADALVDERADAAVAEAALLALVEGSDIALDEALVEAELRARFDAVEGALLRAAGVPGAEVEACLAARLVDEGERADARFRLRADAALHALREREGMTLSRDDLLDFVRGFAEGTELEPSDVARALAEDLEAAREVEESLARAQALAWILERVEVEAPEV